MKNKANISYMYKDLFAPIHQNAKNYRVIQLRLYKSFWLGHNCKLAPCIDNNKLIELIVLYF